MNRNTIRVATLALTSLCALNTVPVSNPFANASRYDVYALVAGGATVAAIGTIYWAHSLSKELKQLKKEQQPAADSLRSDILNIVDQNDRRISHNSEVHVNTTKSEVLGEIADKTARAEKKRAEARVQEYTDLESRIIKNIADKLKASAVAAIPSDITSLPKQLEDLKIKIEATGRVVETNSNTLGTMFSQAAGKGLNDAILELHAALTRVEKQVKEQANSMSDFTSLSKSAKTQMLALPKEIADLRSEFDAVKSAALKSTENGNVGHAALDKKLKELEDKIEKVQKELTDAKK